MLLMATENEHYERLAVIRDTDAAHHEILTPEGRRLS